jgi:sugar O-acyltransferase (sialic acid O-acetyltransferase NeuD family)
MKKKDLILIGGGGHCRAVIDVIESGSEFQIAGILDLKEKIRKEVLTYPIIGSDEDLDKIAADYEYFVITIGQIQTAEIRRKLFERLQSLGKKIPVIISPRAYVSKHATIGYGTVIMHDALVNAGASIGHNCILNSKSLIEHDSTVGDHCHIATNAIVNGGCTIGSGVLIGSNSVLLQGTQITQDVTVGAGSVVTKNLLSAGIYIGSPAIKNS